jgi:hypothetical protein
VNFDNVCYKIVVFLGIEREINQIKIGECLNGYTLVRGNRTADCANKNIYRKKYYLKIANFEFDNKK